MNLGSIAKGVRKAVVKNSASILASFAVTGVVATSVMVGRATFKAAEIIREEQLSEDLSPKGHILDWREKVRLTWREKVRLTWREYIPAAGIAALTVASIVGGHRVQSNKIAAISAAYAFADKTFETYRDKVIEKIGERKNLDIVNEVAEERMRENPPTEFIILQGDGDIIHDMWSNRWFRANIQDVRAAANDVNEKVYADFYVPLSTFYDMIGLGGSKAADTVGFNPDRKCELVWTTSTTPDGRPCHAIDFRKEPSPTYTDFH